MGRHNGSWAKFHPQMRDHAKTRAAVRVLVDAGIPAEFAYPIVLAAVPALSAWALSDGDTGRTGGLSDARFLAEAWPEAAESTKWRKPATGALLRRALTTAPAGHDSGFLEGTGEAERIHDFAELYADVLAHRRRMRERRGAVSTPRTTTDSPPPESPGRALTGSDTVRSRCAHRAISVPFPRARPATAAEAEAEAGGEEPPPGVASRPTDPDPEREAVEAIADALDEDPDLVRRVLRELALRGVTRDQAVRIALALDGPIGAWDFKAHALKVAHPPKPAAPDHGARPPSDGRGLATSRDHATEAERIRAEFEASGYVDRNAWNADRRAGQIRTGPAAATRRFDVGTMSAVDVAPDAVGA